MKYVFARNINNMGMDGIIDPTTQTLLCLCHEEQSKIILDALSSPQTPTGVDTREASSKSIPCGGCGETDPNKRCIGCMHKFYND